MSDQPGRESLSDDLSTYSVDDEDQLTPEDTLIPGDDPLEEGFETPDKLHGSLAQGVTAEEQAEDETIDQRVRQEIPEEGTAYGAPERESDLDPEPMAGGDDPDAIPAEQDFVGEIGVASQNEPEAGTVETGAGDLNLETTDAAEEVAMHTVDELGEQSQQG